MGQIIPLKNALIATQVVTMSTEIVTTHVIVDTLVTSITESQEAALVTVSTEKEATIKDIALMAGQYPELMSEDTTVPQLAAMRQEAIDCEKLGGDYSALSKILLQRAKILRNNIMCICTDVLDNGKLASKKNSGIKDKVKEIKDTHYKRGARKTPVSRNMIASSSMVLGGVQPGKPLVNTGKGILSILNVDGNIDNMMKINPSSSEKIPKTWTNIVITNLSATDPGSFDVFMK